MSRWELIFEGSQEITDAIGSLSETILYAFIFVVLVVMAFLGRWRATLIICMTIPVSLICSFIYLFATGSTLNIISLSSLSIAIGMVVDDAIVVLENITTHIERGSNPKEEAAIYATNEVWLSVIATTLVVVAVFLPLTMVPGMAGILFRELGWIVTIVVCVSTTAAISLTPMMSAYLLKLEGGQHDYKGLGVIYKPIDRALEWLDDAYARSLDWVVRHRRITFFSMMSVFVVSLGLLTRVPTEFFPPSDNGRISAMVELEQNARRRRLHGAHRPAYRSTASSMRNTPRSCSSRRRPAPTRRTTPSRRCDHRFAHHQLQRAPDRRGGARSVDLRHLRPAAR